MPATAVARTPTELKPAAYATKPWESRGRRVPEADSPTRTVFQRDRDRILHSAAFRRLEHKTQVFQADGAEPYRSRLTHSLEVAQITRTACRCLGLDEDLGEAVALAHDLGHAPFGHAGGDALDAALRPWGGFDHNDQSLRIVCLIECRYAAFDGLNLSWETVEGLAKHNGPQVGPRARPGAAPGATARALDADWRLDLDGFPGAEAQLSSLCDDVAYNAHDLDDGWHAGLFGVADLVDVPVVGPMISLVRRAWPELTGPRLINEVNRRVITALVDDLLAETRSRLATLAPRDVGEIRAAPGPVVAFSAQMAPQEQGLRRFLLDRMYRSSAVNRMTRKAHRVVGDLARYFMDAPDCLPEDRRVLLGSAHGVSARARVVADHVSSLTDRAALREFDKVFDPHVRT